MKRALGNLERQLFAYTQLRNLRALRTRDLTRPLSISGKQERELLNRLAKAGMIAQVRRGLYLVPPRLPLGGKWTPEEVLALEMLVQDREGCYQICGPNAFNRYGFDNQIPTRVYAYNNRISGERTVGTVALTLIKVAAERLGDTEQVQTAEGLARNPMRMDYYKKYQEIIADYNREKDRVTMEETFAKLIDLANSLDAEQQRAAREGLSDDELALFDLLFKENISQVDREKVKQASRGLACVAPRGAQADA